MIYLLIYTAIAFTVAGNLTQELFERSENYKGYISSLLCVLLAALIGPPIILYENYKGYILSLLCVLLAALIGPPILLYEICKDWVKYLTKYLEACYQVSFWRLWYFNRKSPKLKKGYWDMRAWKIRLGAPKVIGRRMKKKVFNKLAEHNGFNDLMY